MNCSPKSNDRSDNLTQTTHISENNDVHHDIRIIGHAKLTLNQQSIPAYKSVQLQKALTNSQDMLRNQRWSITPWSLLTWQLILPYIQQTSCREMLCATYKNIILSLMIKPKFTHIKHIYLRNNSLASIEPLSFINAPTLESIDASSNKITTTKSFQKVKLPCLKLLVLDYNQITQICITRLNLNYTKPIDLMIDSFADDSINRLRDKIINNLTFYVKIQSKQFGVNTKKAIRCLKDYSQFMAHQKLYAQIQKRTWKTDKLTQ